MPNERKPWKWDPRKPETLPDSWWGTGKVRKVLEKHGFGPKGKQIFLGAGCGDGWADIIDRYLTDLEERGFEVQIDQIKEKFGGLRIYDSVGHPLFRTINSPSAEMERAALEAYLDKRHDEAEKESYRTCEECGERGKTNDWGTGWYKTLCKKHGKERKEREREERFK